MSLSFEDKVAAARTALESPEWSNLPIDELTDHMSVLHVYNQQNKTASFKLAADDAKPGWIGTLTGLLQKYPALAGALLGSGVGAIGTALNPDEDERDYLTSLLYGGAAGGLAGLGYGLYNDPSTIKNWFKEPLVKKFDPEAAKQQPVDYSRAMQEILDHPHSRRSGELGKAIASSSEIAMKYPQLADTLKQYAELTTGRDGTTPQQLESYRRMFENSSILGLGGFMPGGGAAENLPYVPGNSSLGSAYQWLGLGSQALGLLGYGRDAVSAAARLLNPNYVLRSPGALNSGLSKLVSMTDDQLTASGIKKELQDLARHIHSHFNDETNPLKKMTDIAAAGPGGSVGYDMKVDLPVKGNSKPGQPAKTTTVPTTITPDDMRSLNYALEQSASGVKNPRSLSTRDRVVDAFKTFAGYRPTNDLLSDLKDIYAGIRGIFKPDTLKRKHFNSPVDGAGFAEHLKNRADVHPQIGNQNYARPTQGAVTVDIFKNTQAPGMPSQSWDVNDALKSKSGPVHRSLAYGKNITNRYAGRNKARARAALTLAPEAANFVGSLVSGNRANSYAQQRADALAKMQQEAKNIPQLQAPQTTP